MAEPYGKYANYFDVGVNTNELVIDFGQCYGRGDLPTVHTRIVTTPVYGRELLSLLARSMMSFDGAQTQADGGPTSDRRQSDSQ
jgi:hypothetical protein